MKSFMTRYYIIILLLLVSLVFVGRGFLKRVGSQHEIRNVVLISIDTCRADYLSCYGYPRKTTPNIDAVAEEGILFENVISPVAVTLPAHASMLTGTDPIYHGIHDNHDRHLAESNTTLAEMLKDNGFATGAVISAFILDSRFGMDQGFDSYNDRFREHLTTPSGINERKGAETSRLGIEWLDKHKDEKFFLFMHYYDPHNDYQPPEPFASEYASNLYAGEIAYTDHCIGRVISKLKKLNLYDSTLIVITADHGEMLGEHGALTHGYFIYQGGIRVPLIFKLPGKHKSRVITKRVSLIDIAPTIYGLLGIEVPSVVQGEDLSCGFGRKKLPEKTRYLYCENLNPTRYNACSLLGIVTDRFKYIQTTRPELYDLIQDPQEKNNLVMNDPQRARILKDKLSQILKQFVYKGESDSKLQLDTEARRRLESLGYVGGGVDERFDFDQSRDDPKDLINFHKLYIRANTLICAKKFGEAEVLSKKLLSLRPNFWGGHFNMAFISQAQGNLAEAIQHLQQSIKLKPDHPESHEKLAKAFQSQGNLDEAVRHYRQALHLIGHYPEAYYGLGSALAAQGKIDEAISQYSRALEFQPDNHFTHFDISLLLLRQGKYDQAVKHFNEALRLKPDWPKAHYEFGSVYYQQGRIELAITHWTEAVRLKPDSTGVLNNLAWVLAVSREEKFHNPEKAIEYAKCACELTNYKNAGFLDTLSVAYAAAGRFSDAVSTAQKALETAESSQQKDLTEEIQKHIELYKTNQPYCQPPPM